MSCNGAVSTACLVWAFRILILKLLPLYRGLGERNRDPIYCRTTLTGRLPPCDQHRMNVSDDQHICESEGKQTESLACCQMGVNVPVEAFSGMILLVR